MLWVFVRIASTVIENQSIKYVLEKKDPLKHDIMTYQTGFISRCEKTGLRGFRPGPTQTGLHSCRR